MVPIEVLKASPTECEVAVGSTAVDRVILTFQEVQPGKVRCMGREGERDTNLNIPHEWFMEARRRALAAMNPLPDLEPEVIPSSVSPTGCSLKVGDKVIRFEKTNGKLKRVGNPVSISASTFRKAFDQALAATIGARQERVSRQWYNKM